MKQGIIISRSLERELAMALAECEHDKLFVLADVVTAEQCWPVIKDYLVMKRAKLIVIGDSDTNKTIDTLADVWKELGDNGASRHSCLINLGGGMVTDLGGFAASTFKRGINFNGLKNEVGVFNEARYVILDTNFLKTLDDDNMRSGYAEMLKHGLISDEAHWAELVSFPLDNPDLPLLQQMVARSVQIKENIVAEDPHEKGIRKALNLGHTFGHAFESWALRRTPVLHGHAVACGLICELYLSSIKAGFPADRMRQTVNFIHDYYPRLAITCEDYGELIELMTHDKKNADGIINFTLLGGIGDIRINQTATEEEIKEALDFYREG